MSGWLRLIVATMIPFVSIAACICTVQTCARRQLKKRMISLEDTAERLRYQRAALVHKLKHQVKKRMSLTGTATEQIKLSKSRSSLTSTGSSKCALAAQTSAAALSQTSSSAGMATIDE